MASFLLPAELTLIIAEYLDPESTLNFALTRKNHAALCKPLLEEHKRLLSEWQTIDTTDATTLLWRSLNQVLDYPPSGWYVRELNMPPIRQYDWSPEVGLYPEDWAPSAEEKDRFKIAAQELAKLYPVLPDGHLFAQAPDTPEIRCPNDLVGTIQNRIDKGIEDGVVAILLHYLPNLTTIRLTEVDDTSDCLRLLIHRVAGAYQDTQLRSKLPLQHLTTAAVARYHPEGCSTPDWACSFLSLPSLRTFAASQMGGSPSPKMQKCYLQQAGVPISNVTALFLYRCRFDVEGLGVLLAGIKNLKKLAYDGADQCVSWSHYEPRKVIQLLVARTGNSLEELWLDLEDINEDDYYDEPVPALVSLRGLAKLRFLNCPWEMVRPIPEESDDEEPLSQGFYRKEDHKDIDTDFDVRDILPRSLEKFYMHGSFYDTDGHYEWQALERAFGAPNPATPHLTMENTCIRKLWNGETRERIGTAEEPISVYQHSLGFTLFDGHGYM